MRTLLFVLTWVFWVFSIAMFVQNQSLQNEIYLYEEYSELLKSYTWCVIWSITSAPCNEWYSTVLWKIFDWWIEEYKNQRERYGDLTQIENAKETFIN